MLFLLAAFGVPVSAADAAQPAAAAEAGSGAKADPMDWPFWRGPEYNGISRERNLPAEWDRNGKNLLWKNAALGSRSTPIVMNGKLYAHCRSEPGTPHEGEKVVCADAKTGEILWENAFSMFLCEVPAERVGWSSVVGDPATGRVYALAVNGLFQCIDGESGKTLWSRALTEEFGMLNTYGGRTNFPVVFEDLVIINGVVIGWGDKGKPVHTFLAFDKMSGELVWVNGTRELPYDTTYSSPAIGVLGGQAAMVFGSGDGAVWAFKPRTGEHIWKFQLSRMGMNVTPIIDGETVYMSHSEENPEDNTMGAVVAINGVGQGDITKTGEVWRVKGWVAGKSSPIVIGDRLYAADDSGGVYVINKTNGELIARQKLAGTVMRASLLYADNKIYACTTSAWHVLEPTEDGVKVLHRMRFPLAEEIHATPIASHGRIYLTTVDAMYCLALPDVEAAVDERPPQAKEEPIGASAEPAHVQLVPAETLLKPGEKVEYTARLFNDRGQFLKEADAKYTVDGPGEIDAKGVYVADSSAGHVAATVKVEVDGVQGSARLRVIPDLPWKFDFSDQQIPRSWIGVQHRHVAKEVDGEPVLAKLSTIRAGTRSQGILGRVDMHDYTIQADVCGKANAGLPDIGLIAQRYTMEIMGKSQQMIVRTWTPQPERFSASVPLEWSGDVWYTLKFQASNKDDRVVLRGKVWPRDEKEPEAWTIEAEDLAPNFQGAPGLFGNATFGEILLDNITVTSNE